MRLWRNVAVAPTFHDHPRLMQHIAEFAVQQFVPQLSLKDSTYLFSNGLPGSIHSGAERTLRYGKRYEPWITAVRPSVSLAAVSQ